MHGNLPSDYPMAVGALVTSAETLEPWDETCQE